MKNEIVWEGADSMGRNPASVEMDTGKIILNRDVYPYFSDFTQQFIKEHELGHYKLPTDSEYEADAYALNKLYGSTGKSLKKSMKAITDFLPVDDPRVIELYKKALLIDSKKNNNKKAKQELIELGGSMRNKLTSMDNPFVRLNAVGRPSARRYRADGEDPEGEVVIDYTDDEATNDRKRRGKYQNSQVRYTVFGIQMTILEILFAVFIIIYLYKTR
jgi:hypothetical protein